MVSPPPPSLPPPWPALLEQLNQALSASEHARAQLLATIGEPQADAFERACAQLAHTLAALQHGLPALQRSSAPLNAPPAPVRLALEQLGASLGALSEQTTRLSARDRRALDLLFPNDGLKAYSRLGGRGPSLGGSAYLKA